MLEESEERSARARLYMGAGVMPPTANLCRKVYHFSYENQLEGCFQVSLRRVLCHGGGELVPFVVSHQCSCLRIYHDPGVFAIARLHTLRVISGFLLPWIH